MSLKTFRLDCEIELPVPSVDDRYDILKVLLSKERIEESDMMNLAKAAHGFVAADLQCLVAKAMMQASSQDRVGIEISDLTWALSLVKPSAMREVLIQVPNVSIYKAILKISCLIVANSTTLSSDNTQSAICPLAQNKTFNKHYKLDLKSIKKLKMPKINHENATKQEKHHMRNEVIPSLNTKVITHWMVEQDTVSNMLGLHNILMFLKVLLEVYCSCFPKCRNTFNVN